jgi:hypothetical protein
MSLAERRSRPVPTEKLPADEFSHPPNALYVIKADGTALCRVVGGQDFKGEPDWTR